MSPEEIINHCREELIRWAMLPGNDMSYADACAFADERLVQTLAQHLSSALICMGHVEHMFEPKVADRAIKQLYNWG